MENENAVVKGDYLKMMPIEAAKQNYLDFINFVKSILKKDLDFGVIPGTPKPSLYKPGAEKLRFVYGIGIEMNQSKSLIDYDRKLVDFTYKATAKSPSGAVLAECEGNCNSMEVKFGYLWKPENELPENIDKTGLLSKAGGRKDSEFAFAIEKAETGGQYGKPKEYWDKWNEAIKSGKAKQIKRKAKSGREMDAWEMDSTTTMYRIPNPDVIGMQNTIMKMAQKRAFVGAILLATGASEFFTQDIEDMDISGKGIVYSDEHPVGDGGFVEFEEVKEEPLAGHWYAKLEKCKTKADVDALAEKHKETIVANPQLKKAFTDRNKEIRLATTEQATS